MQEMAFQFLWFIYFILGGYLLNLSFRSICLIKTSHKNNKNKGIDPDFTFIRMVQNLLNLMLAGTCISDSLNRAWIHHKGDLKGSIFFKPLQKLNRELISQCGDIQEFDPKLMGLDKILFFGVKEGAPIKKSLENWLMVRRTLYEIKKDKISSSKRAVIQCLVVSIFPIFGLALVTLVDSNLLFQSFGEPLALKMLFAAILLNFIGFFVMRKMIYRGETKEQQMLLGNITAFSMLLILVSSGRSLSDALSEIRNHLTSESFNLQIQEIIIQSEESGSEVSNSLRELLKQTFIELKGQIKTSSELLNTKLAIPTFIFIFPAAFIMILFPYIPLFKEVLIWL